MSFWLNEFSSQMCKCEPQGILLFFIYIGLDPHELYWACNVVRGKRAMKERIRQAQRMFEGYIE